MLEEDFGDLPMIELSQKLRLMSLLSTCEDPILGGLRRMSVTSTSAGKDFEKPREAKHKHFQTVNLADSVKLRGPKSLYTSSALDELHRLIRNKKYNRLNLGIA